MTLAVLATAPSYARVRPVPPVDPPYDDEPVPHLRLVAPHVEEHLPFELPASRVIIDDLVDRRPTDRAVLPDPRPWAARLIIATMEALNGRRPVQQLMPWTNGIVYGQVSRAVRYRLVQDGPGLLRSVHVTEPATGVAEVCAIVSGAHRSRAVAARLEGADGKWRCTALKLL